MQLLFDNFDHHIVAHCASDPGLRSVSACADKVLDAQVLLDPCGKDLDLPAVFVQGCDGGGRQTGVVGQKDQSLARSGVIKPNTPNVKLKFYFLALLFLGLSAKAGDRIPFFYPSFIDLQYSSRGNNVVVNLGSDIREFDYLEFDQDTDCNTRGFWINNVFYSNETPLLQRSENFSVDKKSSFSRIFDELFRLEQRARLTEYEDTIKIVGRFERGLYRLRFNTSVGLPYEIKWAHVFGNYLSGSHQRIDIRRVSKEYYEFFVDRTTTKLVFFKNTEIFQGDPKLSVDVEYYGVAKLDIQPLSDVRFQVSLRPAFTSEPNHIIEISGLPIECIRKIRSRTTKVFWMDSILAFPQWYLRPVQFAVFRNSRLYVPFLGEKIHYVEYAGLEKLKEAQLRLFTPKVVHSVDPERLLQNSMYYKFHDIEKYYNLVVVLSNAHRSSISNIFADVRCKEGDRHIELVSYYNGHYFTNLDSCQLKGLRYVARVPEHMIRRVSSIKKDFSLVMLGNITESSISSFIRNTTDLIESRGISTSEYALFSIPK